MVIKAITQKNIGGIFRYEVNLTIKGKNQILWLQSTNPDTLNWFISDRIDGIIVMLLQDILANEDCIESDIPISDKLYNNLTLQLIPAMVNASKGKMSSVIFKVPIVPYRESNIKTHTVTGMSFGVDSMYTYYSHKNDLIPTHKIDTVSIFNHGAFNGMYTKSEDEMRTTYGLCLNKVKMFAVQEGVDVFDIDCNINEICSFNYTQSHTFRTAGICLMFGGGISTYYYASGYSFEDFSLDPYQDSAYYDIFILSMISSGGITFYSDAMNLQRIEKN